MRLSAYSPTAAWRIALEPEAYLCHPVRLASLFSAAIVFTHSVSPCGVVVRPPAVSCEAVLRKWKYFQGRSGRIRLRSPQIRPPQATRTGVAHLRLTGPPA